MCTIINEVESNLSCSLKIQITAAKTLPNESALRREVVTLLMVYEMLLLQ